MKALLLYVLGLTVVVFLAAVLVFHGEMNDRVALGVGDVMGNANAPKTMPAKTEVVGYRLGDERFDPSAVAIDGLEATPKGAGLMTIRMRLVNKGAVEFPHLRVILLTADGKLARALELSPDEYVHERVFSTQNISIEVQTRAGEARFAVEPFFKEGVR